MKKETPKLWFFSQLTRKDKIYLYLGIIAGFVFLAISLYEKIQYDKDMGIPAAMGVLVIVSAQIQALISVVYRVALKQNRETT